MNHGTHERCKRGRQRVKERTNHASYKQLVQCLLIITILEEVIKACGTVVLFAARLRARHTLSFSPVPRSPLHLPSCILFRRSSPPHIARLGCMQCTLQWPSTRCSHCSCLVASFAVISFFPSYPTGQKQWLVIALFIKTNNCAAALIKHIRKERTQQ